jgi:hypothetical protein
MVSSREATASIYGAWRLARLDPRGLSYFNTTEAGFWRSFWAAAISAPAYVLTVAFEYAQRTPTATDARIFAVHAIAYVISWTAFPLVMATVVRMLDRERYYVRYIVAHNWANVVEMVLFVLATGLAATGIGWFTILPAFTAFLIFGYQWYVARIALEITGLQAMAVIGLDLLLDMALMIAMRALLPGGPI